MSVKVEGLKELEQRIANAPQVLRNTVKAYMITFSLSALAEIQRRSPVDTGMYRNSWRLDFKDTPGYLFYAAFYNNMPYAYPLDYGSPVGGKPWPSAGPKTVENNGRIFSSQAPEGVAATVLTKEEITSVIDGLSKLFGGII